jgi:hypothetical protein
MTMAELSERIYAAPISEYFRDAGWLVPTVQSIHIIAIALLVGSSILVDLKLAGVTARTERASIVYQRYMPWVWSGLLVLLLTGAVMSIAEPDRVLTNWMFWIKMALVLVAFLSTLLIGIPMRREDLASDTSRWSKVAKPIGWLSLAIWIAIIVCGRWIAYV